MGLTHYWDIKDADKWASVYDDIVADVRRIVDFVEEHPEWMGYGKRSATNQDFRCIKSHFGQNAVAIDDIDCPAETFYISRKARGFNFCKTNGLPFDVAVKAMLLRAFYHAGDAVELGSDRHWEEWQDAVRLVKAIFDVEEVAKPAGFRG
ncbi:hypothetical protein K525DRAFT_255223 [Schizophyllum commune Loenen D]|nr:hypothetical protein K525DRAFT_255223 [Schizophyllum commune Loenen D]